MSEMITLITGKEVPEALFRTTELNLGLLECDSDGLNEYMQIIYFVKKFSPKLGECPVATRLTIVVNGQIPSEVAMIIDAKFYMIGSNYWPRDAAPIGNVQLRTREVVSTMALEKARVGLKLFESCNLPYSSMWIQFYILFCKGTMDQLILNEEAVAQLHELGLLVDRCVPEEVRIIVDAMFHINKTNFACWRDPIDPNKVIS